MQEVPRRNDGILGERPSNSFPQQVPLMTHVLKTTLTIWTFPTAQVAIDDDPITDLKARDAAADGRHDTGTIRTGDVGIFELQAWPSFSHPEIQTIEGCCSQLDLDLAHMRGRCGYFPVLQDF
jgi:hypothetical protein